MTFPPVSKPAASSFNSCKINERPTTKTRIRAAIGFDHEPDRGLFVAATLPRRAPDACSDGCGVAVAGAPAGGCLSRSVAANRRDHHPMARTRLRGSGAVDHGARRSWDERHSEDDHATLHFALWVV